ncbi:MAG TPA: helix-turn-helix transcriptional regulator [Candidatus Paceibacterota bacterium]
MKNKEITIEDFVPFDEFLAKKMKDKKFKKAFLEERSRSQLAYEIKMLRKKRHMTQAQVAKKADMPQSVVARIESGSRGFSVNTLHKIAGVFDREVGLVTPRR